MSAVAKIDPGVWGHADLTRLRKLGRTYSLDMLTSFQPGVTREQVDLALWALLGRSIDEAVVYLNGGQNG